MPFDFGLTLDSSWGGGTSNSYLGLTDANSVVATYLPVHARTKWTDATTPDRIAALLQATRQIDSLAWTGDRVFYTQNLEFPRTDREGERFPWATKFSIVSTWNIYMQRQRERVLMACALQAVSVLREGDPGQDEHRQRRAAGITNFSESIGRVSQSVSYGRPSLVLDPEVLNLLREYRGAPRVYRS